MEFLQNNWIWLIVIGLFVWLQASGRGCCGHRSHGVGQSKGAENANDTVAH